LNVFLARSFWKRSPFQHVMKDMSTWQF
jgi:hypothetical protein